MGKIFVGVLIGVVLVGAVLGVYGLVNAQAPATPLQQGQQPGYGMMGGGRGTSRMGLANDGQPGPMHDLMIAAWADKLGLSVDVIDQRLDAGETMYDIAVSQGLTADEFQAARVEIHNTVLDEAVSQGLITQEQADWMKSRGGAMGAGNCLGGGGHGRWESVPQTNP
ncbi:hypothetical protein LARV_03275 [Longilinea arvoryzae]|uniref:Uncharacterized protein n=1 Tax=Longilinea arvoryzae TaxID=360412 RepID=A0A0S7BCR8_9CHLR|nr:hypothetical protein [Longilinea arvoryzae]GAP15486.1 hypothetical protein LARV_03275 [Longilinea arvoryzae]